MNEGRVDYETHILIGVNKSGSMRVIAHWPHVPRQAEVDSTIQTASEPYGYVYSLHTDIDYAGPGRPIERALDALRPRSTWLEVSG